MHDEAILTPAQPPMLDADALPVVGAEAARQPLEPREPLNQLIARTRARTVGGNEA